MRFSRLHAASASIFLLAIVPFVSATPYPPLAAGDLDLFNALDGRGACPVPCGAQSQYCCNSGEACFTDSNNIARCTAGAAAASPAPAAGGNWQLFTTVYVTTAEVPETVTNVYSLHSSGAGTVTVTVFAGSQPTAATCNVALGQIQCGVSCCGSGQFCNSGQCMANGATTGGLAPVATATVSAAIRPTSISTFTVITSNGATSTVPFLMPATATASSGAVVSSSSSSSSLSGGAIAGIVIGVLAGIIILILIIICCCARGLLDLIRPKRKTEITEVYEGHHHASGGAPPKRRFGIFGGGGGNNRPSDSKKGWVGIAGILAAVALVLGLKRRHDRKIEEKESSVYTYSDYTYDYSTSASSESSEDRRTRLTRSDRRSSSRR